jgi:hypothetical protein
MPREQMTPHQVFYAHGGAYLVDEQFYFEDAEDARWYYDKGWKHDRFVRVPGPTDSGPGDEIEPDRMNLWIDNQEVIDPKDALRVIKLDSISAFRTGYYDGLATKRAKENNVIE